MIAWTSNTHGRGPGFRSRAELRRRRGLRALRVLHASHQDATAAYREELLPYIEAAEREHGAPFVHTRRRFNLPIAARAPFYRRWWRAIVYYFSGGW